MRALLTSRRVWLLSFALVAIAATILGLAGHAPITPELRPQPIEPWQLPVVPKAEPEKAMQILSKSSLWGKLPEPAAAESLIAPQWRILGVAKRGSERFVMIQVTGQPPQQLIVNDTLPGGSKILQIEDGALCLLVNGKKRMLSIYKQAAQIL